MLPAWPPPPPTPSHTSSAAVVQRGVAAAARGGLSTTGHASAPRHEREQDRAVLDLPAPLSGHRPVARSQGHLSDATSASVSAGWRPCNGSYLRRIHGMPGTAPVGRREDRRAPALHAPDQRRHPAVIRVGECQAGRVRTRSTTRRSQRAPPSSRAQHRHVLGVAGGALAEKHRLGRGDGRERAGVGVERGDARERRDRIRPASAPPPPAASRRRRRRWCRPRSPGCRRPRRPGTAPRSTAGRGTARSP